MTPECQICGSSERADALGRIRAVCTGCGALERHRALARLRKDDWRAGEGRSCLEAGPANRTVFGGFLRDRGWAYTSVDRWRTGNPNDQREVGFVDLEIDLCDLSVFADGEFDLFIAQHVVEEIEDFRGALDEIARVLGPNGTALLEIPFQPDLRRSRQHKPDHFGNVWEFGADLLDELRSRYGSVETAPLEENSYSGTVFICTEASLMESGGNTEAAAGGEIAVARPLTKAAKSPAAPEQTPSVAENQAEGDELWWRGRKAPAHAIEGYASWPSVEPGGRLDLHVSTRPATRYRICIHRLGWYGGRGGRLVLEHPATGDLQGTPQPIPAPIPGPSIVSCDWPVTDSIQIGRDWPSGQYVARLVIAEGELLENIAFVPFVVRPPLDRRADILVQMPVTTAQAYNNWGGKSLYPSNSTDETPATRVTFDRPFPSWHEANLNARWPFIWDFQLIRFLEREGYDVAYTTDLDTHCEPWFLLGHPLVMTSGHDEYWSVEMRDAFDAARAGGASLACMGANTCYWQVRFEDGERTMVEYRRPDLDPEPSPPAKTQLFRDLDPPRPECKLWGVQYQGGVTHPKQPPRHYVVTDEAIGDSWLEGTGLEAGATLEGLVGYEWDAVQQGHEPPDGTVFFHYENELSNADSVRHRTPSGGIVFAAGSLQFSWGLDNWAHPDHTDPRLQRFMNNALADMIAAGRGAVAESRAASLLESRP